MNQLKNALFCFIVLVIVSCTLHTSQTVEALEQKTEPKTSRPTQCARPTTKNVTSMLFNRTLFGKAKAFGHQEILRQELKQAIRDNNAQEALTQLLNGVSLDTQTDDGKTIFNIGMSNKAGHAGYTIFMSVAANGLYAFIDTLTDKVLNEKEYYACWDLWVKLRDRQDDKGYTALMHAASNGHKETVEKLLNLHADKKLKDFVNKKNAAQLADENNYPLIATFIREFHFSWPVAPGTWQVC